MSSFSDILVKLRKQDGLTQVEAAKRMGITRSALAMYETGKREPDFETLELIADFYNVNMDTLYGRGPAPEESKPATGGDGKIVNDDPELTEILECCREDPHMRMLFSLTKNAKPQDLETAIKIIQAVRGE